MITFIRSAVVAPGKTAEAFAFAKQIAELVQRKHGATVQVLLPVGGNPARVAWLVHYEGLAHWEALNTKLLGDPDYMSMIGSTSATFVPGSLHDEIWKAL